MVKDGEAIFPVHTLCPWGITKHEKANTEYRIMNIECRGLKKNLEP